MLKLPLKYNRLQAPRPGEMTTRPRPQPRPQSHVLLKIPSFPSTKHSSLKTVHPPCTYFPFLVLPVRYLNTTKAEAQGLRLELSA